MGLGVGHGLGLGVGHGLGLGVGHGLGRGRGLRGSLVALASGMSMTVPQPTITLPSSFLRKLATWSRQPGVGVGVGVRVGVGARVGVRAGVGVRVRVGVGVRVRVVFSV